MKREIPLLITFITGLAMIAQFFIPHAPFDSLGDTFQSWFAIIATCAAILGVGNLIKVSLAKIARKRDFFFNIILLAGLFITAFTGIFLKDAPAPKKDHDLSRPEVKFELFINRYSDYKDRLKDVLVNMEGLGLTKEQLANVRSDSERLKNICLVLDNAGIHNMDTPEVAHAKGEFSSLTARMDAFLTKFGDKDVQGRDNEKFMYIYKHIYEPLSSTMFSLLAFFIASAAFRAFRAKTFEAGLLLVSAFLVMLGRVPIGTAIWGRLPEITDWIMAVPNTAGQRAIMIGAALGVVSASLKILVGIERTYLGGGD
jgi:hypothetical protein